MKKVPAGVSDAFCLLVTNIANLIKVKSIVTFAFVYGLIRLLSGEWAPAMEVISIFSSALGSIITYFFMKKDALENVKTSTTSTITSGTEEEAAE